MNFTFKDMVKVKNKVNIRYNLVFRFNSASLLLHIKKNSHKFILLYLVKTYSSSSKSKIKKKKVLLLGSNR